MHRNLFKFTALKSFKIVWMICVVLLSCAIVSAQSTVTQSPKPVKSLGKKKVLTKSPIMRSEIKKGTMNEMLACIQDLKVTSKAGKYGKILTVTFRTLESVVAEVSVQKWGSRRPEEKPDWVRVNSLINGREWLPELDEYGSDRRTKNHGFEIKLDYVDVGIPGNKYRLDLLATTYKDTQPDYGKRDTFSCKKEFNEP
ncbi:MAG: hypothetical protein LC768_09725 [Acidobacteria bacterium]|nr:hypothetical protein [Acidobacteriota bacterium]MCA1638596.1 hypothetical protein [Acidobacteriota bacterium]